MDRDKRENLYRKGRAAIKLKRYEDAKKIFEMLVIERENDARFVSHRGLLMALVDRQFNESVVTCKHAIALAPSEPQMHLNLARVFCSVGQRAAAVVTLRRAVRARIKSAELASQLERLSPRSTPPIASLGRSHFLNSLLGKLRARCSMTR